jgi:DinB superfamily
MDDPVASLYPDWPQYAARIRDAVKHLTEDQLALRAGPEHAPIWALAAHVAGTRVYWLCGVFQQPGADRTPFTEPLSDTGWEDDLAHPRAGDELGWALDSSWDVVRDCLERWSISDVDATATRIRDGVAQRHSRASVLNRICSHDAFHAGEISQLLGLHRLPPIDLWAPQSPTGP